MNPKTTYKVSFLQYTNKTILMPYNYDINIIQAHLKQIQNNNKQETEINHHILQCTFASKSKVIDITNSAVLEDIKAHLQNRDGPVTLEFADKEDESREGREIDRKNNSNKKDENKKGSRIDRKNNSKNKDN